MCISQLIFFKPIEEDYQKFSKTIKDSSGKKVWVHCADNARASAFIFRYRSTILKEDSEVTKCDVREIWEYTPHKDVII